MLGSRGKILVIRGGAIGDFILTLPVLSALRQQFPHAHLEVIGYSHIAQLALTGGLVDQVRSIEARALAGFFARNAGLDEKLAEYFSNFALIVSYLYDPDEIFQSNVARSSKAQFIAGPHRPSESEDIHATQVFLKPLERLGIFDADPIPRLDVRQSFGLSEPRINARASSWLALHPGSGSPRKNWPEANWATLLQRLQETTDINFLMIGGEAEGERLMRLSAPVTPTRITLAQSLPLPELASRLSACRAYIGHDSGITHLAAAVGLRGLVLWGASNEKVWSPRSERILMIRAPGELSELSVEDVASNVRSALVPA